MQSIVHYFLHFGVPLFGALWLKPQKWFRITCLLWATMAIDLDHFFAWPDVFVADRCSLCAHPFHQPAIWPLYGLMLCWSRSRVLGIGLCLHMLADGLDCLWMQYWR